MKKLIFILGAICFVLTSNGCKKETVQVKYRISKLTKTVTGSSASNAEYIFKYNSNGKIDRINVNGSSDTFTFKYAYSSKLDSISKYKMSNGLFYEKREVIWSGNNVASFSSSTLQYDSQNRLEKVIYLSGSFTRFDYSSDSLKSYYKPVASSEYYEGSYITDAEQLNPFKIINNENEDKTLSFALSGVTGNYNSISSKLIIYARGYNSNGSLYYESNYTPDGNTGGYPDKITITSTIIPTVVFEFTYEAI